MAGPSCSSYRDAVAMPEVRIVNVPTLARVWRRSVLV